MLSNKDRERLSRRGLTQEDLAIIEAAMLKLHGHDDPALAPRREAALQHAAQGGDPLALKLSILPLSDGLLARAAHAYGALQKAY